MALRPQQLELFLVCELCFEFGHTAIALYDGKTCGDAMWAHMCEDCFQRHGQGLGVGRGHRLSAHTPPPDAILERVRCKVAVRALSLLSNRVLLHALLADNSVGFCLACGVEVFDVALEAREQQCPLCLAPSVYGAAEVLKKLST